MNSTAKRVCSVLWPSSSKQPAHPHQAPLAADAWRGGLTAFVGEESRPSHPSLKLQVEKPAFSRKSLVGEHGKRIK